MKVSHETPKILLEESRNFNDYDYALVHHFPRHPDYFDYFKRGLEMGREVILDNSLYELGNAFDSSEYIQWIQTLKPTYYIIPDTFWDAHATIEQFKLWNRLYEPILCSKSIGVAQGSSYKDICWCYRFLEPHCDKMAFTFKFHPNVIEEFSKELESLYGDYISNISQSEIHAGVRYLLLNKLASDGVINTNKPHHLLGMYNIRFLKCLTNHKWIDSIDTSNPITLGLEGRTYTSTWDSGEKPSTLIDNVFEMTELTDHQRHCIEYNLKIFRQNT